MNKITYTTAGLVAGLALGLTGSASADTTYPFGENPDPNHYPTCSTVEQCRDSQRYWYDVATTYEWSVEVNASRERDLAAQVERLSAQVENQKVRLARKDERIARLRARIDYLLDK